MAGKMMKNNSVMVVLMVGLLFGVCSAETHIVGDGNGWTNMVSSPSTFYSTWASKQNLQVGDVLQFNFANGVHTVAPVSKVAYDACNTGDLLSAALTTSPAEITLNTSGTHYFICTFHCNAGQKLAVNVKPITVATFNITIPPPPVTVTSFNITARPPTGNFAVATKAGLLGLVATLVAFAVLF